MNARHEPVQIDPGVRSFLAAPHGLFIAGESVASASGGTFSTVDPANGMPITDVAYGSAPDVDRAVKAARDAFDEGPWPTMSAADRSRLLARFAQLVQEHAEEFAQLESLDNGKPLRIARAVDVPLSVAYLEYFAGWPTKIEGDVIPVGQSNMLCYTQQRPVGVCGQIVPWNFPLLMSCWATGAPLAAGCTIVLKPAEQTPLAALRLADIAMEAGLPAGVLNVVPGDGSTGAALVRHPGVDKIAFTGSTRAGREVGAECGRALKRVTLELGGKSPNIVLPDADFSAAVKGAFQGIYYNTGQACNAGSRLFVPADSYDDVLSGLAQRASRARIGPGLDPNTQLGPVISDEQRRRVAGYVEKGRAEGAELVAGGGQPDIDGGFFVEPTLFSVTSDRLTIAREEIFGPVLVATPYQSLDEVVARANDTEYGLAAGVWTRDVGHAHTLAQKLRAGSVYINIWGPSDAAAPFGGMGASGVGRIHGRTGLDAYLETTTVWTSLS